MYNPTGIYVNAVEAAQGKTTKKKNLNGAIAHEKESSVMKNKRLDLSYSQMKWEVIFKRILVVMSANIDYNRYRDFGDAYYAIHAINKIAGYRIFMGKNLGPGFKYLRIIHF